MATPSTTQAELQNIVNGMVHSKFLQCDSPQGIMNRAVRYVVGDIDLRSSLRSTPLSPNMFSNQYDYASPADLKGDKLVDFRKTVNRPVNERFILIDEKDFDRKKTVSPYRVAVRDENFIKLLRISGVPNDVSATLNKLDSLTGNGTWAASGDATNLTLDTDDYINGAAFNFDTNTGGTTAILETSDMDSVDLSDYDQTGSIFAYINIPDTFTISSITNFILRFGNDSSNYWSKTITTANDGNAFKAGWNLLRFDWSSASQTGTVDPSDIDYLRFTITKSGVQAADTDWILDEIIFRKGEAYDTSYYSKYGWQTTAGAYIEESTTTTDLVVGDTDEIEMIAFKAAEFAAQELKEYDDMKMFRESYNDSKKTYEAKNPTKALKKSRNYGMMPRFQRGNTN